ncbi:MAG: N-acetyltransferase family protein [Phycisphaerales bacterium]
MIPFDPGATEHRFTTRAGTATLIRPVRVGDAADLHACIRAVVAAGQGVVRTIEQIPEDHAKLDADLVEWTDGTLNGPRGARLMCEVLGAAKGPRIIGEASIRRMSPRRLRHVAHLSIEVHPGHQGQGVGRALMHALLAWVKGPDGVGIARVDLDVFAVNTRAVNLYRSLGFEIEGTRKRFVRFEDGSYSDDLVMALMV